MTPEDHADRTQWFLLIRATYCSLILLIFARLPKPMFADTADLVERAKSAVVTVTTDRAEGSGWFISPREVITNLHVVSGAAHVAIKVHDGRTFAINGVLAADATYDVVILSVDIDETFSASLPLAEEMPRVGEHVVVVGSPRGFDYTVSDGIISAIRDIGQCKNVIQMTAPISPGSSGGPLLNKDGKVVGMATFTRTDGQLLNFAMPYSAVEDLERDALRPLATLPTPRPIELDEEDTTAVYNSIGKFLVANGLRRGRPMPLLDLTSPRSIAGRLVGNFRISQVLGPRTALVDCFNSEGVRLYTVKLSGINLERKVDGQPIQFPEQSTFYCRGTHTYQSAAGLRTVYDAVALEPQRLAEALEPLFAALAERERKAKVEQARRRREAERQRREIAARAARARAREIADAKASLAAYETELRQLEAESEAVAQRVDLEKKLETYRAVRMRRGIAEQYSEWENELKRMPMISAEERERYVAERAELVSKIQQARRQVILLERRR